MKTLRPALLLWLALPALLGVPVACGEPSAEGALRWGGAAYHNAGWNARHIEGIENFFFCT